jgi:gamma-glutamyltranspeptidase / glutathione hydrolase
MKVATWISSLIALASASVLPAPPAASPQITPHPPETHVSDAAPLPVPGRSMVVTRDGIVATSQPLAARAGVAILEHGGNAIDAAIATNATMGLMEPTGNGIGGDMFAIVYEAKTGTLHGLNASGWAPTGLSAEMLRSKGLTEMPQHGIYSVTVPGVVGGWQALHDKFGKLGFDKLLAPAIYYAENGFPVGEITSRTWNVPAATKLLAAHPNSKALYLIDGVRGPRFGEVFKNPDLAKSLRRIADKGRDGYYLGPTAEAILAISKEAGGTMTAADLSEYQPEWVTPIKTTYHGWTVYELPPNGQGIAALEMLNLMERFPLAEYGFHSPRSLHVMIEAKKLAYADLLEYIGDPRFATLPVAQMIDKARAAARAKLIDPAQAHCEVKPAVYDGVTNAEGKDTIYLTVIDRDGNIVSLIQSNYSGFGSGLVPPGAGFMLHNRGGLFSLAPNQPNTLAPRHRPLHTIIPAFMEKDGVRIGFGIMGGWNQAQAHAQFVANIVDYGMTLQQALEAGRFTKPTFAGCDVEIEELIPASTREALTKLGHEIKVIPRRSSVFGWGQAVMSDTRGVHYGASEPRHDGMAVPETAPIFSTSTAPATASHQQ